VLLEFFVPTNRRDARFNPTHLDGTNEIIHANRAGYGFSQESENVAWFAAHAIRAARRYGFAPIQGKAYVRVTFIEGNRRRDEDNIKGGIKYVLDSLTPSRPPKKAGAGLIADDGPKYCTSESRVSYTKDRKLIGAWVLVCPIKEKPKEIKEI
jgi:hypothetical protein